MVVKASGPRPTVVFVDDDRWDSFIQLAAILRKAKYRTVRITVAPSGWRAEHLLFDRYVSLPLPPDPDHLSKILSTEYISDVQPTESLAMTTYAALELLPASQWSRTWTSRSAVLDKWKVSTALREFGLRTPDTILADLTSPAEAVNKLSLPIVLKRRVGASGSNVNVFESLESLQIFFATVERPGDWFFEKFIHGESLVCASCVSDEGVDVIATYEVLKRIRLRGPSSIVIFGNDAKLEETAKVLIEKLNLRGLMCFDIIRDSNGDDWIHDVNPRVFGGFCMGQLAGFDFRGAYFHYLSGQGQIESSQCDTPRTKSFSFPEGRRDLFRSGVRRNSWIGTSMWIWRYWRLLGTRYFLFFIVERPVSSVRRNWERFNGRITSRHIKSNRVPLK
jgi:hypothetical protein